MQAYQVAQLPLGPFGTNCYVLWGESRRCLVVDPGGDPKVLQDFLAKKKVSVEGYLITHGHADHVGALAAMHKFAPAWIAMHPVDAAWAFEPINALPPYIEQPDRPDRIERNLAEGQTWTDAGFTYSVLETPGHSPGSVSFFFNKEGLLFSGDVLFQDSVGRVDLPGGSGEVLMKSLRRLQTLPDSTRVFPGHGPETTIGAEKKSNPFLR